MISHEQLSHEHFEELCSLAALGQISDREFTELQAHLTSCDSCGSEYADYVDLVHSKLSLMIEPQGESSGKIDGFLHRNSGHKKRFLDRAKLGGFYFSEEARRNASWSGLRRLALPSLSYKYSFALITIFSLMSIGVLGYWLQKNKDRSASLTNQVAKLSSQNIALQQRIDELSGTKTPLAIEPARAPATGRASDSDDKTSLEKDLSRARDDYADAQARVKTLEDQVQAASAEIQALRSEGETSKNTSSQLESKLREAEASAARMNDELQKLREGEKGDASASTAQEARIRDLSEKLREQTDALDRERRLLVAGRDIRDLMGARNLHIMDVFDVDGKGKSNPRFGRVFYTQGKSLIFYAFDLGDKKASLTKASFQAWGYRAGDEHAYQSLGIFYVDDKNQNRWVLKFDDPEVLSQIDSVFVTVEPPGGSRKPTGEKLLYNAYLNNQANHP